MFSQYRVVLMLFLLTHDIIGDRWPEHLYLMREMEFSSRLRRSVIRTSQLSTTGSIAKRDPDAALVSQSDMDLPWEQFIVHGPMTVNLLGQLMVVSSKLDFSFREYQPTYSFVYIRYPDSFRATLTQIANGKSNYSLSNDETIVLVQMVGRPFSWHI